MHTIYQQLMHSLCSHSEKISTQYTHTPPTKQFLNSCVATVFKWGECNWVAIGGVTPLNTEHNKPIVTTYSIAHAVVLFLSTSSLITDLDCTLAHSRIRCAVFASFNYYHSDQHGLALKTNEILLTQMTSKCLDSNDLHRMLAAVSLAILFNIHAGKYATTQLNLNLCVWQEKDTHQLQANRLMNPMDQQPYKS